MQHTSSPTLLAPGVLLAGKYRLLRLIGEGGMAAVWAARNEATTGEVAIKLLRQPDAELRLRLQREARAGAVLKHRNILDVYDLGETEAGEPFLVMQLLSGETLADLLARKRRLDSAEAARIGRDIAAALAAAHEHGIVHRDLKPANIFLQREPGGDLPVIKVLDFGVAKDLTGSDGLQTALGTVIGSPFYMSPEQALGRADVDHRADLWALGVVMFEMLAGIHPFQGDRTEAAKAILSGPIPRVSRYMRMADGALERLVDGCLRRDRSERAGSAARLAAELDEIARRRPATAPPAPVRVAPAGTVVLGRGAEAAARPPTPSNHETSEATEPLLMAVPRPELAVAEPAPGGAVAASGPQGAAPSAPAGGGTERLAPKLSARAEPPLPAQTLTVPLVEAIEPPPATERGGRNAARRRGRSRLVALGALAAIGTLGAAAAAVLLGSTRRAPAPTAPTSTAQDQAASASAEAHGGTTRAAMAEGSSTQAGGVPPEATSTASEGPPDGGVSTATGAEGSAAAQPPGLPLPTATQTAEQRGSPPPRSAEKTPTAVPRTPTTRSKPAGSAGAKGIYNPDGI